MQWHDPSLAPGQPAQANRPDEAGDNGEPQPGESDDNAASTAPGDEAAADTGTAEGPLAEEQLGSADERQQALEQWLRQIPDDPAELLRRKFWYEQQQRQEPSR